MKDIKAAKHCRRSRRKDKRAPHDPWQIRPVGGKMDPGLLRSIRAATLLVDPDAPWSELAPRVLPVIKRVWHPYPAEAAPLTMTVAPGIPTGFGIDLGPAFSHVSQQMLERWGVDAMTVLATALDNLRRAVAATAPRIERFPFDGRQVTSIAGEGWGSALLLLPEVLQPILGTDEHVLLAPVRNHLFAMSPEANLESAVTLWGSVAHGAHDELDLPLLFWDGATVVTALGGPGHHIH